MKILHIPQVVRFRESARLTALRAGIVALLVATSAWGAVTIDCRDGLAKQAGITRGKLGLSFQNKWSSCTLITRQGKGIGVIDPVLYIVSSESGSLYWCEKGWPRLKWQALEQGADRDVLYVEGEYDNWLVQAWIAICDNEETAYVRRRTTLMRGEQSLKSARGVLGLYHGKGPFEAAGMTVTIDGCVNPLKGRAVTNYALFRMKETSVAFVCADPATTGEVAIASGRGYFSYYPESCFMEVAVDSGPRRMKAGDFVENTFCLLWGDGDISNRVKAVTATREKLAPRFSAPVRPEISDPDQEALSWPDNKRAAVLRYSFTSPEDGDERLLIAGQPLNRPPAIDGKLDDEAWRGPWAGNFIVYNAPGSLAAARTSFQARYDSQCLYFAVQCEQPFMDMVKYAEHSPRKYGDGESVELFIRGSTSMCQVCVDPAGNYYDECNGNPDVDLALRIAAAHTSTGWVFEVAVPFADLGMKAPQAFDSMKLNVVRNAGHPKMPFTYSAWNPARGALVNSGNLGRLFFGTKEQYFKEQHFFVEVIMDRDEYDALHCGAEAWVKIATSGAIPEGTRLLTGIANKSGKLIRTSQCAVTGSRGGVCLDIRGLAPGEYRSHFVMVAGEKRSPITQTPFRIRKSTRSVNRRGSIPFTVRSDRSSRRLPVSIGIPFPLGVLTNPAQVLLLDDQNEEIPVQATPLANWDPAGSISWLRLNFQTPIITDTPKAFTLRYGETPRQTPSALTVVESPERFVVNTGPLRFTVPRTRGNVLESVAFDGDGNGLFEKAEEMVASADGIGPYLVDGAGRLYQAGNDRHALVTMEEHGPLKAVFRIESWYQAKSGSNLCRQVTRVAAYAGLPYLRMEHTWILTAASGEAVFKDIGFAMPLTQSGKTVFGTDTGSFTNHLTSPRYLLQDTYRHYAISDSRDSGATVPGALVEGKQAPGWIAVEGARAGAILAVNDFWQNFPKELGMENGCLTFHVWPKHGRPSDRPLTQASIGKLDFVHSGAQLDFTVPKEVLNFKTSNPQDRRFIAPSVLANAIGIAKTHRFALSFFSPSNPIPEAASETAAVADTPCAMAGPEWMVASGAFGPLHPRDTQRFPEIENAFELAGKIVPRLNREDGEYGMWIYGQLHTRYNYVENRWQIDRLFNQLHHNGPLWPWIMYFRSGDREYFEFALANTRISADVGFCHYSRPEFEGQPYPMGKLRGGLTDYKSLVPWNAGNRNPDYNSLTDFLLWHYYMTGDGWTRDVALTWGELAKKQGPAAGTRMGAGTVRAALDLYAADWDAGLIPIFRRTAAAMMATQFDFGGFPEWENYTPWLENYIRFTGQAEARARLIKLADAYREGYGDMGQKSNYGTYMNVPAAAYFASGDARYARQARGLLEEWAWGIYSDPDSRWRGSLPGKYAAEFSVLGHFLVRGPYALAAWAQAGENIPAIYPTGLLSAPANTNGGYEIELAILDDDDKPIALNLGGIVDCKSNREVRVRALLLAPDGTPVEQRDLDVRPRILQGHQGLRNWPSDWAAFNIPADKKKGTYRLRLSSEDVDFSVRLPVSDRKEAYPLPVPGRFALYEEGVSMASFYLPPDAKKPTVRLTVNHLVPATVQIRDPAFKAVRNVHLVGFDPKLKSAEVEIPLPPEYKGGFWTILCGVAPYIDVRFTEDWRPVFFSVAPDRAFVPSF